MSRRIISRIVVADGHEIAREELIVLPADVDKTFPNDFVSVGVASICNERE